MFIDYINNLPVFIYAATLSSEIREKISQNKMSAFGFIHWILENI